MCAVPGHRSREMWGCDLHVTSDAKRGSQLCQKCLSATINCRYRLTHYDFLHQTYNSAKNLHKYKPALCRLCFRCSLEEGSLLHSTWFCTKVHSGITFPTLCQNLQFLKLDPQICLLRNFTNVVTKTKPLCIESYTKVDRIHELIVIRVKH